MRLDRLQRRTEIHTERKIVYLCWKSNSKNPLGIAGLHPLSPYHYVRLPSARVSQTLRSFCLTRFKLLRKQTNAGTSTVLFFRITRNFCHVTMRNLPTCNISLCCLTLPASEPGDCVEIILL